MVTRSDTIAGAQVPVRDLAKALIARGHEVTVLVGGSGPFIEELKRNQIPFRTVPAVVRPMALRGGWAARRRDARAGAATGHRGARAIFRSSVDATIAVYEDAIRQVSQS